MERDIVTQLVEFATETKYREIPEEVVDFAKALTLKTVSGMVAGSAKPSGRKMARLIRDRRLPEEVGVIGCGFKTSLWESTFLHSFFAHASELEDDRVIEGVSWDITVIPLLFSLCEKLRLSGKALMEALIVGLEVHARTCLSPSGHLGILIVPGAVGPAVAAAKALELGNREMASAIGLSLSSVPLSIVNFGTDAHYLESTLQCLHGLIAAEMAKEGMFGSSADLITYLSGMLGKEKVVPEKMVEGLGKRWLFCETWIKKYPFCLVMHRYADALLELRKEHNLLNEDVETIEAEIGPGGEICNRPEPKTERDLQFSFQHVLGTALVDGDVNLKHLEVDAIDEPRLKEARSKVKLISHADWPPGLDSEAITAVPARVIVKMKDGRELSKERLRFLGSPEEPLTMEQFQELYSKFSQGILDDEQIRRTRDAILNLEKLSDTDELMDMLVFRNRI